jgi:hypothetical protein
MFRGINKEFGGQHYIDWSKFTFKDFFNGVWHGLKTGLKDAANQLLRYRHDANHPKKSFWKKLMDAVIPGYGHYCGPGIGLGAGEGRPAVNDSDKGCFGHEYPEGSGNSERLGLDWKFFTHGFIRFPGLSFADVAFGGPSVGSTYKFTGSLGFPLIMAGRLGYKWTH